MPRTGSKRSDRRWTAEDGTIWASRFEFLVYDALSADPSLTVRRCLQGTGDTFDYGSTVTKGKCLACGSRKVIQERTYTPDLFVVPNGRRSRGYYIEVKGHLRGPKRRLLRSFIKERSDIDLRILLQRDGAATSTLTLGEYITKYLKIPWHVWDGKLPGAWT